MSDTIIFRKVLNCTIVQKKLKDCSLFTKMADIVVASKIAKRFDCIILGGSHIMHCTNRCTIILLMLAMKHDDPDGCEWVNVPSGTDLPGLSRIKGC